MNCKRFKGYMAEHDISQKELADLLGIKVESANRKVNDKEPFTLSQVKIICQKYGISADDFFV